MFLVKEYLSVSLKLLLAKGRANEPRGKEGGKRGCCETET
jgi:hypothetical protein